MGGSEDQWVVNAVGEHGAALERYVRSKVRDADEAADVCQEVAIRLLAAVRSGERPDSPAAWMYRVATNLVISGARHRAVVARAADALVDRRHRPSVDDEIVARERHAAVRDWLAGEPADDRTAIVLAANGHPMREIASRIGRTELATRALVCRARARGRIRLVAAEAI